VGRLRGIGQRTRRIGRGLRGRGGYILLDVIAAMAIALVGLVVVMGSLATLGRIAVRQASRVHSIVEQRNADAQDQAVFFQGK
jgi:hypothetical protein